jgi:1-acyl-sn-glycerol-3-phosphate acyltransferase
MVRVARSVWIWSATAFLFVVWVSVMAVLWLFDRDPLKRRTAMWFRRLGPTLAHVHPWRLHISGRERVDPDGVYVVVSNHQSFTDIPLVAHVRLNSKWFGKAEMFPIPVVGWMLRLAGDVPVHRGDRRKGAQALMQGARILEQGCSLVFFPEGTRSRDGSILRFNEGPFQLALRQQVPVLPVVLDGSGDSLPRGTWLFGDSADIYLKVLPPVSVEGRSSKEASALCAEVHQKMTEALEAMRAERSA